MVCIMKTIKSNKSRQDYKQYHIMACITRLDVQTFISSRKDYSS